MRLPLLLFGAVPALVIPVVPAVCSFLSLVVSQGGTTFYDHYVLDLNQELVSIPLLFKAGTPVTIRVAGERGYREEVVLMGS